MKKKLVTFFTLTLSLLLILTSCGASIAADLMADVHAAEKPQTPAEPSAEYINSLNTFSWKLFQETAKTDGNILISPASVYLALGMVLNGADTTTRTAMLDALAAQNLTVDQLNTASRDWMTLLMDTGDKTKLSIVNSIWYHDGYDVNSDFIQRNADYYSAAARTLDFSNPSAVLTINDWVKNATESKIDSIIQQLSPDDLMVLINAVYFKAEWQNKFDSEATFENQFNLPNGEKTVNFMHQLTVMDYLSSEVGEGILLPYSDGRFAFVAILPAGNRTPREIVAAMDQSAFAELLDSGQSISVQLSLPKFETRFETSLASSLKQMGMSDAFDAVTADFSLMNSGLRKDIFISDVLHKTFCRVDEDGTEAAAVTAVLMVGSAMPVSDKQLDFNRPFIYGIVDTVTGLPLFLGIMDDPSAE